MATATRPESLIDAGNELLEAMETFTAELHRAGARDSRDHGIAHFSSYHLADLEGNDNGGGWLASNLMADALRAMINGTDEDEEDTDDDR